MNKIHVLDCTLRDGGYCNNWEFGFENIQRITDALVSAGIDVVECGFLSNKSVFDKNVSKFNTLEEIKEVIPSDKNGKLFVAMVNAGEYDADELPENDGKSVDGIRVAFHKKDMASALELCKKISAKGYLVFIQAMVSLAYTDEEFLELIKSVNQLNPYAFYIVDSFGMMKGKDLTRLFYMVEHNLDEKIWIGFHSHNNMQLAYSNAQTLCGVTTSRNLIIDSSVYGMGRGAGNLNTELFVSFLNENYDKEYHIKPLLTIIDEILNDFYQRNYWGYSLPNYLSASHNAHPNYAGYLDDKKTLTVEDMNEIFSMMDEDKKVVFDKAYIEDLYLRYMEKGRDNDEHIAELKSAIRDKKLLLIAPGKSSADEKEKINSFLNDQEVISASVNFDFDGSEYIFLSNLRRFKELKESQKKCIVTSNIPTGKVYLSVPYKKLLNDEEAVKDNAGLMAIRFFIDLGVKEIYLAGFDGYTHDVKQNYSDSKLEIISKNAVLDAMNEGMNKIISRYSKEVDIHFLTTPKNIQI